MLRTLDEMSGYRIQATDGEMGNVEDFLFDDATWTIRYFVVDTGPWLFGRKVLISPQAVGEPSWEGRVLPVDLTKEQVEESPDIDLEEPVSRRKEEELHAHYGWQAYWATVPFGARVGTLAHTPEGAPMVAGDLPEDDDVHGDPHLRSVDEVVGYRLQALEGEIGHVDDFIADDEAWAIRYMVVNTGNWLTGREVLIAPQWIDGINWEHADVQLHLHKRDIKESPPYEAAMPLSREYESDLHDHYGMKGYWA